MEIRENSNFMITNLSQSFQIEDNFVEFPESRTDYVYEDLDLEDPIPSYYDPISFEEIASCLCQDVLQMDNFAVVKNRYSQSYLDLTRKLEKGVSELASCSITKAVLEKKGHVFTKLDDLDLDMCRKIAVYHFRKSHYAIQNTTIKNQKFWLQMLDMEFQWYRLMLRLSATESRIADIKAGKINVDNLIEKFFRENKPLSAAGKNRALSEKYADHAEINTPKALPPSKAASFPVIGKFIRDEFTEPEKELIHIKNKSNSGKSGGQLKTQVSADKINRIINSAETENSKVSDEKFYGTMKQRKKAERLARKRMAASEKKQNLPAGQKKNSNDDSEYEKQRFYLNDSKNNSFDKGLSKQNINLSAAWITSEESGRSGKGKDKPPER